jgi:hypothetical protein
VHRIFLLSPANCSGRRAQAILAPGADFPLARRLKSRAGAPLGEVFSFVSGLYFRGKLAYATRFAHPPDPLDPLHASGVLVITPNAGLRASDACVTLDTVRRFAAVDVDVSNAAYRRPLERAARTLDEAVGTEGEVVLLGSIASGKYVDVLLPIFGQRLVFPSQFVGRGDMSRGGLMLRSAAAGAELDYSPVAGAERHGPRPPKLDPIRTGRARPSPGPQASRAWTAG